MEALSQSSGGVEKNMIKRYIQYLEAAFLIKIVHRIDHNAKKFSRANYFKIYLTNPSLRSALFTPLQATDKLMGTMVETAIYAQWLQREWFEPWYARWSQGRFQGGLPHAHCLHDRQGRHPRQRESHEERRRGFPDEAVRQGGHPGRGPDGD